MRYRADKKTAGCIRTGVDSLAEGAFPDEPFSAFDRPLRLELRRFLREVKDNFSIAALLVTHDFEEAVAISDKIIIYEQGKIAQIGSPESVKGSPVNQYVSLLTACDRGTRKPYPPPRSSGRFDS